MLVADAAKALQESWFGGDGPGIAHHRFEHDTGDLIALTGEEVFNKREVIEGQDDKIFEGAGGLAWRARDNVGIFAWACLIKRWCDADQDVVEPAVVVTLKAEDEVASSGGTRKTHGGLYHFGAAQPKAAQFGGGDDFDHLLRQVDFELVLSGVELAFAHGVVDGVEDARVGMTEDHWPLCQDVVDVAVAIDVVDHGPFGMVEKEGVRLAQESNITADTASEGFLGELIKLI